MWIEGDARTSIEKLSKNDKVRELKGSWLDIHDQRLSTHDTFVKLSHMKVFCGCWRHTRCNRFDAAPMKFVYS